MRNTQLHLLLDAVEAGREQYRVGEVRVGARVERTELDARGIALARLVLRNAQQRGTVVVAPADVARCLVAAPQALVRVDELVGDCADFRRMVQDLLIFCWMSKPLRN